MKKIITLNLILLLILILSGCNNDTKVLKHRIKKAINEGEKLYKSYEERVEEIRIKKEEETKSESREDNTTKGNNYKKDNISNDKGGEKNKKKDNGNDYEAEIEGEAEYSNWCSNCKKEYFIKGHCPYCQP